MTDKFDVDLFHAINQHATNTSLFGKAMMFIAHYGLEIYAILFIIAWFALPRREEKKRHALLVSLLGGVIALLVNAIIGAIWFRPRPFTFPNMHAHQLIPHGADASFPSDHVSGGFGFASAAWRRTANWFSWLMTILSIVMMYARVYVGVHWPTDVIGGLVVGILCGQVAKLFSSPLEVITRILLRIFRMGRYV